MFKPTNRAPEAFMARYNKIMNGEENLDTVAKLKDFWLFAVAQGKKDPSARKEIAKLSQEIAHSRSPLRGINVVRFTAEMIKSSPFIAAYDSFSHAPLDNKNWKLIERRVNLLSEPAPYAPGQTIPLELRERFETIASGKEILDSTLKLKKFWQFALEIGKKSDYTLLPEIGELMFYTTLPSNISALYAVRDIYIELEGCFAYLSAREETADEQSIKSWWLMLEDYINDKL